jgi:Ca2+-transporting ATPase
MAALKDFYFHSADINAVFEKLGVDPKRGLTREESRKRLKKHGFNVLKEERHFRSLEIILRQIKSPLVFILIIAGVFTLYLKEYTDFIVIFIAVLINTLVGYIQEKQASDSFRKLKSSIKKYAVVLRDGLEHRIESSAIVPGDILILREGDQIPADARIFEEKGLEANESILTGEWLSSKKSAEKVEAKSRITEQTDMLWMGTLVVKGWAKAVVCRTGKETELGKIAGLLKEGKEKLTPMQKNIASISRLLTILVTFVVIAIFLLGVLRGESLGNMFITSVAVAVAAIPEGLPVAITVILALGMRSILKKGGLVRKLNAAETLGSCDIILTDKTGTLTEAKMQVSHIIASEQMLKKPDLKTLENFAEQKSRLLKIGIFTSDAFIENPKERLEKWIIRGGPMDKAIFIAGIEAGMNPNKLLENCERIDFLPFDAERRFVASINKGSIFNTPDYKLESDKNTVYISGAPETILAISSNYIIGNELKTLTAPLKKKIKDFYENITMEGVRMIAVAFKNADQKEFPRDNHDHFFGGFTFCGLIGFHDPIRENVASSLQKARSAGVRTVMVTGDHKSTALAVAQKIGLLESGGILSGEELEKIGKKELEDKIENIDIFSRVLPHQKMDIVEAWQSRNKIVAMTGDGVNDAPALKRADIGVAVESGTDVAKEASDIVILNNSFSVIVAAIEQGRIIIDNIRKVVTYLLATGFTEVILIGSTLFLGYPLPVLPAQILWANIIQEGFMNFAYAFEPKEKDVMTRSPEDRVSKKIINAEMKTLIFIIGIITDLFLLALFFTLYKMNYDLGKIRTIMFAGLSVDAIFFAFSLRSLRRPIWKINPFSNPYLILALGISLAFLLGALLFPPIQNLLHLHPISFFEFLIVLGLGVLDLAAIEVGKLVYIRRKG